MTDENHPYYRDAKNRQEAIETILECIQYWPSTREHRVFKGMLAELNRLRNELAALKAKSDPLAEMWRELESYQPQADRDGHGDSWRIMCRERTQAAAGAARDAALAAASDAASAGARAVTDAARARAASDAAGARAASASAEAEFAIAAIRRAKGVQP